MRSAIKPDKIFFEKQKPKQKDEEVLTEEERTLATLSDTSGWVTLKEYIENLVLNLEATNSSAIESGLSFEEIGKNTVIINLVKGIVSQIINKVEDAKEYRDSKK